MKYGSIAVLLFIYYFTMELADYYCCLGGDGDHNITVGNESWSGDQLGNVSYSQSEMAHLHSVPSDINASKEGLIGNTSNPVIANKTDTSHHAYDSEMLNPPKKELPMAMIIAGPAAAFGIMFFLCVLYYWHTKQLDQKAKELSFTLYVTPDASTDALSPVGSSNGNIARPQKLVPAPVRQMSRDSDIYFQRRKSTLTVPGASLPPPSLQGKRGSSWSALADQEILNISSPRRHSTFIL